MKNIEGRNDASCPDNFCMAHSFFHHLVSGHSLFDF